LQYNGLRAQHYSYNATFLLV